MTLTERIEVAEVIVRRSKELLDAYGPDRNGGRYRTRYEQSVRDLDVLLSQAVA
jgi:hypothetical protein